MRKLAAVLLVLCSFAYAKGHSSGSHSHSSRKSSSAEKTEHVRGYTRKDGTYVAPYYRHPAGTAPSYSSMTTSYRMYRRGYMADGIAADGTVQRDKHGRIKRSAAAKHAFERWQPCPSTGKTSGRCPGYIVDHVKPLECGGPDDPSNMQWQTVAAAKAKDKTEGQCRL